MVKPILITLGIVGGVVFLAYGLSAGIDVLQGKQISDIQGDVLGCLLVLLLIIGYGLWSWIDYETNPLLRKNWRDD